MPRQTLGNVRNEKVILSMYDKRWQVGKYKNFSCELSGNKIASNFASLRFMRDLNGPLPGRRLERPVCVEKSCGINRILV